MLKFILKWLLEKSLQLFAGIQPRPADAEVQKRKDDIRRTPSAVFYFSDKHNRTQTCAMAVDELDKFFFTSVVRLVSCVRHLYHTNATSKTRQPLPSRSSSSPKRIHFGGERSVRMTLSRIEYFLRLPSTWLGFIPLLCSIGNMFTSCLNGRKQPLVKRKTQRANTVPLVQKALKLASVVLGGVVLVEGKGSASVGSLPTTPILHHRPGIQSCLLNSHKAQSNKPLRLSISACCRRSALKAFASI